MNCIYTRSDIFKKIVFIVFFSFVLLFSERGFAQTTEVSVPFSEGFIGTIGNNPQDATNIKTFATLGISRAFFVQTTSTGQFAIPSGYQGNDIPGTIRLQLSSGTTIDIQGAIVWRETASGNTIRLFGALPNQNITPFTINSYTVNSTSNIGLKKIGSTLTFADGQSVSGNAATSGILQSLNDYLQATLPLRPTGPVAVNVLNTANTTPTITGTVTLNAGESLSVNVNGITYTTSNGLIITGNTWSLTIPNSDAIPYGIYSVTATILNGAGYVLSDATTNELTIYNSNDTTAPVITGPSGSATTGSKSIPENTTAVTTYTANEVVTWSLNGGEDAAKFSINSSTGALTFTNAPDYENPTDGTTSGTNTYIVIIKATDTNGNTTTQTLTVTVTDVDDIAPVITGPNGSGTTTGANAVKSIPENTVNVYTFTANESVTWSITSGPDQAKFTIDPNTGLLRFVSPPDYETPTDVGADNVYVVVLTATDAAGNTTTQTVSVTVTFVCGGAIYGTGYLSGGTGRDSNWKIVALPQGFTPPEALPYSSYVIPGGTLPGIFVDRNGYTDANGDTFYWVAPKSDATQLLGTNYNWIIEQTFTVPRTGFYDLNFSGAGDNEIGFYINGSINSTDPLKPIITGGTQIGATWNSFTSSTTFSGKAYLTAGVNRAYMVMRDYGGLTTAIISGGSFSCTPLLNGPGAGLTSTKTIPENTTDIFTFTSDEPVTWSINGGEDAAKFSIDANGKLVFVSAPNFENPTDGATTGSNTYIVVVKALSTFTGLYTEQTVTVYVADVDEIAPVITGPSGSGTTGSKFIPENTTAVTTYTANEVVTWSLNGGEDAAKFSINSSTGALTFTNAPDYENPTDGTTSGTNTYIVIIKATDTNGNSTMQTLTVTVTDVVENLAPTNIILSQSAIYEKNQINAIIGNLSSTDPDVGDTHTYTLVTGAGSTDNGSFSIAGNQLKANISFNFSTKNSYSIRIRTTDAGGLSFEKLFIITIIQSPIATGTGNIPGTNQITAASNNVTISKGFSSQLNVTGPGLVSYSWSPSTGLSATNTANPIASPLQTTVYTVTVTNSFGLTTVLLVTVNVVEDYNVTANNVITPNGDGINDFWVVENLSSYPDNEVKIFDKAGRILHQVKNYQNNWNGTINAYLLAEGTYYYVIDFGQGKKFKKGYITIIRN